MEDGRVQFSLLTKRPINKGEELTYAYIDALNMGMPIAQRRPMVEALLGFKCHCAACRHDSSFLSGYTVNVCARCSKPADQQCVKCKAVRYCSKGCQKAHWSASHKKECKTLRTEN